MANEEIQNLLRTGIQAAQSGNKMTARHIFRQIVDEDPNNELAWIWMASVAETTAERRACLEKVLEINPGNQRAREAISKVEQPAAPAPAISPTPGPAVRPERSQPRPGGDGGPRDALLRPPVRHRRRLSPPMIILVGLLAVCMIGAGFYLLWDYTQNQNESTPTKVAVGPTSTRAAATATPRRIVTMPPPVTLPGTWTPAPTETPVPTIEASATPVLATYTLLVSGQRGDQYNYALYQLQADGSQESQISLQLPNDNKLTLLEVLDASYSPDGQQIVFTAHLRSESAEFEDLFIAPSGGGTMQQLTTTQAVHTGDASWSPDGSQILYSSDVDGDYDIYVISSGGGQPSPITNNDANDRNPVWSPDGTALAYASDQGNAGVLTVWRMNIDGSEAKQLTNPDSNSFAPAWSPDGRLIAFISDRGNDADLYVMRADGSDERLLTVDDNDAEDRDPAWSPDGTWIAFSSNRATGVFDIFLIHPDGSGLQQVTNGQGDNRQVVFKP